MLEVRILNGLKCGISFSVDEQTLSIGSEEDCDIPMLDAAFQGAQCKLYLDTNGLIKLDPIKGTFQWANGTFIKGETLWNSENSLYCGGIWLQLAEETASWPGELPQLQSSAAHNTTTHSRSHRWRLLATCAGLVGLSALGLHNISFAGLSQSSASQDLPAIYALQSDNRNGMIKEDRNPEEKQDYFGIIQNMLAQRELKSLELEAMQNGLRLQGNLNNADQRILARMLIRYELEYPNGLPIDNQTLSIAESFPTHIIAVVGGPYGHIVLEDGTRLSKGQSYQGYRLIKISKDKVLFDGKATLSVNW